MPYVNPVCRPFPRGGGGRACTFSSFTPPEETPSHRQVGLGADLAVRACRSAHEEPAPDGTSERESGSPRIPGSSLVPLVPARNGPMGSRDDFLVQMGHQGGGLHGRR